jgi:mono/diheme cytochrome c family protein
MRLHLRVLGVLAIVASAAACDESLSTLAGPTPNLEPTFSSIQRDIFETTDVAGRAACVSCHTNAGRTPAGGLNLLAGASYGNLVNVSSTQKPGVARVVPNSPDASYLAQKIDGTSGIIGRRMPFNGPPYLTDGQIQILRSWIEKGAQNN